MHLCLLTWLALQATNDEGETALHLACIHSSLEAVEFLIAKNKAALNQVADEGLPIHYAARATEGVGELVETYSALKKLQAVAHAAPDTVLAKSHEGRLPLHIIIRGELCCKVWAECSNGSLKVCQKVKAKSEREG